ncbi:MAG: spoVK, partial [Chthoniobacter sp.]|nr:spoVK [Chthoniobacter sp.]
MDEDSMDFTSAGESLTPVERLERLIASLPPGDLVRRELLDLRADVAEREDMISDARQALEKYEQVVKKLSSPANRIGTFLSAANRETAQIVVGGADYFCNCDPRVELSSLRRGTRVLVNEAYVIVGNLGYDRSGPVVKITEVLGPDRLRVGSEHGVQSLVLERSDLLLKEKLKAGDEVRVDANYKIALEVLARPQSDEYFLDTVPELPWEKVGGQQEALAAIRDAIELPLLHPQLFAKFQHATPKGFLLHGPPGCGKTLIGKATAYNLTQQLQQQTGEEMREYFMHIKGPEILNMWVGESERMVREIFATAREKRREGFLPFLFIDEAESILGTRRASRFS